MHDDRHQATLYFTCDLLKNRDRAFSSKFIIMTLSNNYKTFTHTMHEFDEKYFYFQPFCLYASTILEHRHDKRKQERVFGATWKNV